MTTTPTPDTLLAVAAHLTEDGNGLDQTTCDQVAVWLRAVADAKPAAYRWGGKFGEWCYDEAPRADRLCEPLFLGPQDRRDADDAARYRWLRDKSEPGICAFYLSVGMAFHGVRFKPETVDEAIDAARAQRAAQGDVQ